MLIPKGMIFVDSTKDATSLSEYLNSLLPAKYQVADLIVHYHSFMSEEYLDQAWKNFEENKCRIMITTSKLQCVCLDLSTLSEFYSFSQGVDLPDIMFVIQLGICSNPMDVFQRFGRAVRNLSLHGFALLLAEDWAFDPPPDLPITKEKSAKSTPLTRRQKTSKEMFEYVQSKTCLRKFMAAYLGDTGTYGEFRIIRHIAFSLTSRFYL